MVNIIVQFQKTMKTITLLLTALLFSASSYALAKWPEQPKVHHPSIQQFSSLLKHVGQAHARALQMGFPDSAVISSWDNGSWTVDGNVGIRYQNNKISRLLFYVGPIPVFQYVFNYDAAGRGRLIETQMTLPGQPVQVTARFIMNYDANGNQTSMWMYEEDNGSLVLANGDSLQFTYSGNVVTEAIQLQYDNMVAVPAWRNAQKFTNLTFGTNGHLTGIVSTPWDPNTNTWLTAEDTRYSNIEWKLGYPGLSSLLGGLMDVSRFLFTELPFSENEYYLSPTDYIEELKVGGVFVNEYKVTSTVANGLVTQALEQEWSNSAWVDNYRVVFSYNGSNMTQALNESYAAGNWVPDYRESWTFDASSNLTEEKQESYVSGSWVTNYGRKNLLDYTSDNRVYRWVTQDWDPMAMQYVNYEKREYYFGNFALRTAEMATAEMKMYPNPAQTEFWLEMHASEQGALLQVYQMNGQLALQQSLTAEKTNHPIRVDVGNLTNGIYRVVVSSPAGKFSKSLLKM